jgi:hypothetical protein
METAKAIVHASSRAHAVLTTLDVLTLDTHAGPKPHAQAVVISRTDLTEADGGNAAD